MQLLYVSAGKGYRDLVKWISVLYIIRLCQRRIGLTLSDIRTNLTYKRASGTKLVCKSRTT